MEALVYGHIKGWSIAIMQQNLHTNDTLNMEEESPKKTRLFKCTNSGNESYNIGSKRWRKKTRLDNEAFNVENNRR